MAFLWCLVDRIERAIGHNQQAEAGIAPYRNRQIARELLDHGRIVGKDIREPVAGEEQHHGDGEAVADAEQARPPNGAARAVGLVLPELAGKLDGSSVRVPTPNVSLVDLVFTPGRDTSAEELNAALKAAAEGKMKGVLDYTDQPLVSSDFNHYPASSTIDSLETSVMEGKLARVVSWYDNEWGFSNRMIDTAGVMAKFL